MAIVIKHTCNAVMDNGTKMLVYGDAGVGKTMLVSTAPAPLLISAEGGMLSLKNFQIPVIEVTSLAEVLEALNFLRTSKEAQQFETICLDSISEIAEVVLYDLKKSTKDPRQAYGEMGDKMRDLIRVFRDLPRFNVYFSAKMDYIEDEMGRKKFAPSMPGKSLTADMPYFFDEVFKLDIGVDEAKKSYRYLATSPTVRYTAKDRSGTLAEFEAPDLSYIINKIKGVDADGDA